jgi:hypothetical protein
VIFSINSIHAEFSFFQAVNGITAINLLLKQVLELGPSSTTAGAGL